METVTAKLTARQRQVLRTIWRLTAEAGIPPTVRDLMVAMGYASTNSVACHVDPLVRKGYLEDTSSEPSRARAMLRLIGAVVRIDYEDSEAGRRLAEALRDD